MRKIAILIVLVVGFGASRPAEACRGNNPCPLIIEVFAYGLGAAMVGGYAYGTGYFAYHDLTDDGATQTLGYGGGELAYNGTFGALFTWGTIDAIKAQHTGTAMWMGSLALAHDALAVHGAYRTFDEWENPRIGHAPPHTREWVVGIGYGVNTLIWTAGLADDQSRTWGIVETSVNAPIAATLGYLAYQRLGEHERGATLLYGSMAALSGAFVYHGVKTILRPEDTGKFDLLGSDLVPVAVSDGREIAPGLGTSGSW